MQVFGCRHDEAIHELWRPAADIASGQIKIRTGQASQRDGGRDGWGFHPRLKPTFMV